MEVNDEAKKIYSETRNDLLTRLLSNTEAFDKAVLSLSSAGLGFSLAFIKDIVPVHTINNMNLLYISWGCFSGAIIFTIISFFTSQFAIRIQLGYFEKYYLEGKDEYFNKKNWLSIATEIINIVSALLFITAVILTVKFVTINMGGFNMADKDNTKIFKLEEGATVPTMQKIIKDNYSKKGATIPGMPPIKPASTTIITDTQPIKPTSSSQNNTNNETSKTTKN
jgi:hypothetical protein